MNLSFKFHKDLSFGCGDIFNTHVCLILSCQAQLQLELSIALIATLGLHLGFSARLGILQVSACKMEPRSGTIITD